MRDQLNARAEIIAKIRHFFDKKHVLEVSTPLLSRGTVTDPYLHSIAAQLPLLHKTMYLQTSPEFAMKQLLAAGSGDIYQVCKAFRDGEKGHLHNPEFTILEWYRVGFNYHELMDEMDELLQVILKCDVALRYTYADAFQKYLNFNPHIISVADLQDHLAREKLPDISGMNYNDRDFLLQLLMTYCIEPKFDKHRPTFIYDYPASQAMLSKIRNDHPPVGERFEVYMGDIELANGFHELTDAVEQRRRFERDKIQRKAWGHPDVVMDENFLAALEKGLPNCAGVALGVDRLVMLALKQKEIRDV